MPDIEAYGYLRPTPEQIQEVIDLATQQPNDPDVQTAMLNTFTTMMKRLKSSAENPEHSVVFASLGCAAEVRLVAGWYQVGDVWFMCD